MQSNNIKFIAWLKDLSKESISVAGGKGANLAEMFNAGFPIPPAFIVTAQCYRYFIEKTGIKEKIFSLLKDLNVEDTDKLQAVAKQIQQLIESTPVPDEIKEAVKEAYETVCIPKRTKEAQHLIKPPECFVAVRSSATAEDLPKASFAGQQATFLNISGPDAVINAVRKCWASLFTARAIYYRIKNKFPHEKVLIAVVVQRMVQSDKSGVAFSINPATNNPNEIVIEAAFGLGEAVVSGRVTPDLYIVDKQTLKIKKIEIHEQKIKIVYDPEKKQNVEKTLTPEEEKQQVLTDKEIVELARIIRKIEQHYGYAQDIEWAIEKGNIYIVQSRPVTTFKPKEAEPPIEAAPEGEIILKGETASAGMATGPVKIVLSMQDLDKVQKGDILVTTMTTPDMVPAMQRAAAIITDEGGLTCMSRDTKILTPKGFITMAEAYSLLASGKPLTVLSFNPKTLKTEWKKALRPIKRKAELIEIAVSQTGRSKQNTLKITPDHRMFTFKNREVVKEELINLLKNKMCVCVADYIPGNSNPHQISDDHLAYLCGALFTDGCIRLNNRRGSVTFTQKETLVRKPFINTVKKYFSADFNITSRKTSKGVFKGREIKGEATDFISSKKYPAKKLLEIKENLIDWVMHLNTEALLAFLAGILDGDGTFHKTHQSGRLHIYCGKEGLAQAIILACLRLGILPQVSKQRKNCYNIQIVENVSSLLKKTKRVRGKVNEKILGTKLFSAKQLLSDIIEKVNWEGKIKPYVENNLLIDAKKLNKRVLPMINNQKIKQSLQKIINSTCRMQRVRLLRNIGIHDVYNFEVEDNHTYIVWTQNYTPIIVWNCHAAIVSREMGTPCIVGTENATKVLKDGEIVTVDATHGVVYKGKVEIAPTPKVPQPAAAAVPKIITATQIKVICDLPEMAEKAAQTGADGVGLVRIEFAIVKGGIHPAQYIREGRKEDYIKLLMDCLRGIAKAFKDKPVWVRTSDLRTDEYRSLKGGELEPKETDPMIGWHGIRRALDEPEILEAELEAIKRLHDEGYKNIGVMIPFVTRLREVRFAKQMLRKLGLEPCRDIEFGVMIETPASCFIIEDICKEGINFISFGTNDLTQLTLGVDRNNERIAKLFDELHPAVLKEIEMVIRTCQRYGVKTSICGQAGSKPEMAKFLVKLGIDSISVNIDAVQQIREVVARTEKQLLLELERSRIRG